MGAEAQEQRHVYACKICGKACVSGRSLGGHMRVHLAAIEASKIKAAIAEIEMACSGGGRDFSNTDDSERGDDDRTGSYGLRENPKKSWRVSDSDPKHGLDISTTEAVCKECGKEFPTSRALWGHMRWHSVRNKNKNGPHHCEECGKGFDSIQAMFGHMNSHSKKRTRGPADFDVVDDDDDDDDDDNGSSAFENLFPIRRKRSMIRYSIATPHPSSSSLNECNSSGAVFEVGDVKEVAEILIMLSKGMCEFDDGVDSGFVAEDGTKSGCANELDKDFLVSNVANGEFGSDREADNLGILKKAHECPVCFKVFPSGQALGGHKRAHYGKVGFGLGAGSKNREAMMIMPGPEDDVNQELGGGVEVADDDGDDADALFDLNFPVRISDGGANRVDVGLGLWAAEIGREVLTS